MKTTAERLKSAEGKAHYYETRAQEERDEAVGARACGLIERAEGCDKSAVRNQEDADVWAATVGKLTTLSRAEIGPLVVEDRDCSQPCDRCRAPANVECLKFGAYPAGWTTEKDATRARQLQDYSYSPNSRARTEIAAAEENDTRGRCDNCGEGGPVDPETGNCPPCIEEGRQPL